MPDRACPADTDQQEGADDGYFTPLTSARYLRITTFNRHGVLVSASVPGVADGDRAYFRARNQSGTAKRVRHAGAVQAAPCGALGFFIYGPPLDAIARQLSGDAASLAAAKLDSRYRLLRRFPARLLRRHAAYYELVPAEAAGDEDSTADVSATPIIRIHIRQETRCPDATTPTSLATVRMHRSPRTAPHGTGELALRRISPRARADRRSPGSW